MCSLASRTTLPRVGKNGFASDPVSQKTFQCPILVDESESDKLSRHQKISLELNIAYSCLNTMASHYVTQSVNKLVC